MWLGRIYIYLAAFVCVWIRGVFAWIAHDHGSKGDAEIHIMAAFEKEVRCRKRTVERESGT